MEMENNMVNETVRRLPYSINQNRNIRIISFVKKIIKNVIELSDKFTFKAIKTKYYLTKWLHQNILVL